MRVLCLPLLTLLGLSACAQPGLPAKGDPPPAAAFDPKQFAKSDIDRVADAHRDEVFGHLRKIAEKLYRRNPREWKKGAHESAEQALEKLFGPGSAWQMPKPDSRGTDAILAALSEDYADDRVAAFIGGLGGMLHAAFEEKTEFFLLDQLNPQKLYNSARNIEIAVWKLSNARDASGALLLLSNEIPPSPQPANLSFEREFGKLVGNLDLLTRLVMDRDNRTIARVVQTLATAVFLPVKGVK